MSGGRFASLWARKGSSRSALSTVSPLPRCPIISQVPHCRRTMFNQTTCNTERARVCFRVADTSTMWWTRLWLNLSKSWRRRTKRECRSNHSRWGYGCSVCSSSWFRGTRVKNGLLSSCRWRTTSGCLWMRWSRTRPLTPRPRKTWHSRPRALGPNVLCQTSSSGL